MLIDNKINFDENKLLSKQSEDFLTWYRQNVAILINNTLTPDSLDEYNRPVSYTINVESYNVTVIYMYKFNDKSSWECVNYNIKIK